jgi:hypothetical protein
MTDAQKARFMRDLTGYAGGIAPRDVVEFSPGTWSACFDSEIAALRVSNVYRSAKVHAKQAPGGVWIVQRTVDAQAD